MKVTVTGATGFIGPYLVDRLLDEGHEVKVLTRDTARAAPFAGRGVVVVQGGVGDSDAVARAVEGSALVFHLARAKSHGTVPKDVFAVNREGTRNVARAAARAGTGRFVHCSSASVYGVMSGEVNEDSPPAPDSAYSRSKVAGERSVFEECGTTVEPVIARISSVTGAHSRSWLGLFQSAAAGTLRLAGNGSNRQHPVDVNDVVDGLMGCAFTPRAAGRIYNIAGPQEVTMFRLREIMVEAVHEVQGTPGKVVNHQGAIPLAPLRAYYRIARLADRYLSMRPPRFEGIAFGIQDRAIDISRARAELGYSPRRSVRDSARSAAEWFYAEGLLG